MPPAYPTVEDTVGNTPLVRLQRLPQGLRLGSNVILCKLEGNNPAGSVKDRPALSMIQEAEREGRIKPGDTLIEATSGAWQHGAQRRRAQRGAAQAQAQAQAQRRRRGTLTVFVVARQATRASRSPWRRLSKATK
jgi:hypothetical protein